jgi:hypothetical protein
MLLPGHRENTAHPADESSTRVKAACHADRYQGLDNTIV